MFATHRFITIASLCLVARGRGQQQVTPGTSATRAAASPAGDSIPAKPISGKTVDVKMSTDSTRYRFDPDTVRLNQGDGIRFSVTSGTHNVTFWPDSIPVGAQEQLNANMPETTAPLTGPLLTKSEVYTVSFAGVPRGTYKGYCTPHLAMGMKLVVVVR